ncbi:hypothetical protein [Fulvitalea axinellae]
MSLVFIPIGIFSVLYFIKPAYLASQPVLPIFSFFESHEKALTPVWKVLLLSLSAIIVYAWYRALRFPGRINKFHYSILIIFFILNTPFLVWDTLGYSFRLWMVFGIMSPFVLCFVRMPDRWALTLSGLLVSLSFYTVRTYQPKKHDPPYKQYAFVSEEMKGLYADYPVDLLICHKSLAEYISFRNRTDVLPWNIPDSSVSPNTYRLAFIPKRLRRQFERLVEPLFAQKITSNYYLVKESDWKNVILEGFSIEERQILNTWRNPFQIRK